MIQTYLSMSQASRRGACRIGLGLSFHLITVSLNFFAASLIGHEGAANLISSERKLQRSNPKYDSQLRIDKRMQQYYEGNKTQDPSESNEYGLTQINSIEAMQKIMNPQAKSKKSFKSSKFLKNKLKD